MQSVWFRIFLLLLSCIVARSWNDPGICDTDSHCGLGHFCMTRENQCIECVNCSAFNRVQTSVGCVKTPDHCGECMTGYSNDHCTSNFCDYCKRKHITETSLSPINEDRTSLFGKPFIYYMSGGIVILFIVAVVFVTFMNKKTFLVSRGSQNQGDIRETNDPDVEQNLLCQPPSYSQAVSTAPMQIVCDRNNSDNAYHDERLTQGLIIQRKDRESTQAATVYRVPSCERRPNLRRNDNNSDNSSNNSIDQLEVPAVVDQDENTLESNWTSNSNTTHHEETNLSVALSEASEVRLIAQPEESLVPVDESASPSKRIRITEDAGTGNENLESVSHSVRNNALSFDFNENILNQGASSATRHNAHNRRRNTQDSQSSDEGETPPRKTQANYPKGNFIVVIQQNTRV